MTSLVYGFACPRFCDASRFDDTDSSTYLVLTFTILILLASLLFAKHEYERLYKPNYFHYTILELRFPRTMPFLSVSQENSLNTDVSNNCVHVRDGSSFFVKSTNLLFLELTVLI